MEGASAATQRKCCAWLLQRAHPRHYLGRGEWPFNTQCGAPVTMGRHYSGCDAAEVNRCCSNLVKPKPGRQSSNFDPEGDCHHIMHKDGPGAEFANMFMNDENYWLDYFLAAWQRATGNGMGGGLKCLDGGDSGDCAAEVPTRLPKGYVKNTFSPGASEGVPGGEAGALGLRRLPYKER